MCVLFDSDIVYDSQRMKRCFCAYCFSVRLSNDFGFREKKKREERAGTQKANEAITTCLGEPQYIGL